MGLAIQGQVQVQQHGVVSLHLPKVGPLLEMAGGVHAMARIAEAASHHRLQHGVVFDQQNSHKDESNKS
jgi:hypothetical protein